MIEAHAGSEELQALAWHGTDFMLQVLNEIPPQTKVKIAQLTGQSWVWLGVKLGLMVKRQGLFPLRTFAYRLNRFGLNFT
eukprot:gene3827-1114_t